ncbi:MULTISPECIES: hypothetical protein [unclassified Nocardioides]|nr:MULTISPECIES: hypothetical protein [unclassified Nocardioides]
MTDVSSCGPWAVIAGGSEGTGAAFADQLAADVQVPGTGEDA